MITLPKDVEAQQESHFSPSPSSPGSSRTPFRDHPSEADALLGEPSDVRPAWLPESSSSTLRPPSTTHTDADLGPPPSFALYEAEYFEVGYEDICSHDPHLNTDGEALYRFLLEHSKRLPFVRINLKGSHTEHKTRWVTRQGENGQSRRELENYTETVTDFDFCLDIKPDPDLCAEPIHWSVSDLEPAYRGQMVKEIDPPRVRGLTSIKRQVKRKDIKKHNKWVEARKDRGYPPWYDEEDLEDILSARAALPIGVDDLDLLDRDPLRSSKTLRQWADEYCASPKYLKEFVYKQELYGWHMQKIESALRSTIANTPYNGSLEISFTPYRSRIYVRPSNALSRALSNKWLKFLSILLLIFPFIWLFKRFHSRGGGRWEVCGGAYPLKRWVPLAPSDSTGQDPSGGLPPYTPYSDEPTVPTPVSPWHSPRSKTSPLPSESFPSPAAPPLASSSNLLPGPPGSPLPSTYSSLTPLAGPSMMARTRSTSSRVMQTAWGPRKLLGEREGEWYRRWEPLIQRAILARYQSPQPLVDRFEHGGRYYATPVEALLDGYLG